MTYQKPYTFRAGTYAKAAEVNANFDTVKDFVDDLQDAIGNVEVSKTPYNKANLQGNPDVVFHCKAGEESDTDSAVNLGQLQTAETTLNTAIGLNTQGIRDNTQAISDLQTAIGNITLAPSYTSSIPLDAEASTFQYGGLLYLTNGDNVSHTVVLGTSNFIIRAQTNIALPVRQGTAYDLTNFTGNVNRRLFTF